MPKIDTSIIQNFDTMTPEQKVQALLGLEIPEKVDLSKYVTKEAFDKKASEAAENSRKLRAQMTEDDRAKADREEQDRETQDKIKDLEEKLSNAQKEITISAYKNSYLAMGYDEKLADETAKALADGKTDVVFENTKKFNADLEKKVKSDLLKSAHVPGGNLGGTTEESDAVKRARELGKAKANATKASNDAMKYYL